MVTLECVKFIQAAFIQWDVLIYDVSKDLNTKVQTSNLNEELGTVHFVFSDKTGTLTQNVMEFKRFSAGNKSYGTKTPKIDVNDLKRRGITNVNFEDPAVEYELNNRGENFNYLHSFLEILSVCHTIIVEKKDGVPTYNASSPDELALVNAAKYLGYSFIGRDDDDNIVVNQKGEEVKYKLLNLIEFTSTRKRMTVIVKTSDDRIKVLCKGADSIIIPRLKHNPHLIEKTTQYLDGYAKEGLRTLLLACKEISEEEYLNWKEKYDEALVSPYDRESAINKAAELMEYDFNLIGSSAIEDKL